MFDKVFSSCNISRMSEEYLEVTGLDGARKLEGEISVNGAKNAVLKVITSAFLFDRTLRAENVPTLKDVIWLLDILNDMGISSVFEEGVIDFKISSELSGTLPFDLAKKLRSSVVLLGPTLARVGEVKMPFPGGDKIGLRPIDMFLDGLEKMGAKVSQTDEHVYLKADKLKGCPYFFKRQSVTATESLMMAAVLADGVTTLKNCAMEPEIAYLANYLNACGADIKGAGSTTILIKGSSGKLLKCKKSYITPGDRIEASSFLALSSILGKDVKITKCSTSEMEAVIEFYKSTGLNMETGGDYIHIKETRDAHMLNSRDFITHEYPGFPTDASAPTVVAMTQMTGEASVFESIFTDRFAYVQSLRLMGADIIQTDLRNIIVRGPKHLIGRELNSIDIRAGLAYVIAASAAKGVSRIKNVHHIDRGYANIENRLSNLGLEIKRLYT